MDVVVTAFPSSRAKTKQAKDAGRAEYKTYSAD